MPRVIGLDGVRRTARVPGMADEQLHQAILRFRKAAKRFHIGGSQEMLLGFYVEVLRNAARSEAPVASLLAHRNGILGLPIVQLADDLDQLHHALALAADGQWEDAQRVELAPRAKGHLNLVLQTARQRLPPDETDPQALIQEALRIVTRPDAEPPRTRSLKALQQNRESLHPSHPRGYAWLLLGQDHLRFYVGALRGSLRLKQPDRFPDALAFDLWMRESGLLLTLAVILDQAGTLDAGRVLAYNPLYGDDADRYTQWIADAAGFEIHKAGAQHQE